MRLLTRYVIRETVGPFLLALAVLTFLLDVQPMMIRAQSFLSKGVPVSTVAYLLVCLLPSALGLTLPMALLIGLLMAFGRLSADRETVALLACGVSLRRLLTPVLVCATVTGLATLYVMIEALPAANQRFNEISWNLLQTKTSQDIHPRDFYTDFPGRVLYVQAVDLDGTWRNVMVADTKQMDLPVVQLAARGAFVLDEVRRTVTLTLDDVVQYSPGAEGLYDRTVTRHVAFSIDPAGFFKSAEEEASQAPQDMTIAQLRAAIADRDRLGQPAHQEIFGLQQKFSFPVACVVLALLGLGLGVHTRKEGKLASFATGLAVLFVYYALFYLAQNLTEGIATNPNVSLETVKQVAPWARWVPNLVLGPLGILLIWWRTRRTDRAVTFAMPQRLANSLRHVSTRLSGEPGSPRRVAVTIRVPSLALPRPRLLDLYVAGRYLRVGALSFVGLLGLFYISTFIDLSAKLFKGQASTPLLLEFFWYKTPQFIYYLVPMATLVAALVTIGALTKTSELTVMRACGVSLYRVAMPLLVFAALWSALLFVLDDRVMAFSNPRADRLEDTIRGRPPRIVDISNRHWLAGEDKIYYYTRFDPRRRTLSDLSVFEWSTQPFQLTRHFNAKSATFAGGVEWVPHDAWLQTFARNSASMHRATWPAGRPYALEALTAFDTEDRDVDLMTFGQLRDEVRVLRAGGFSFERYAVALQTKIAFPLVTIVMTLIAVPFAVTTGRRGALYGIGFAIILSVAYRIAFVAFGALGAAELLPAAAAAWAPDVLFVAGATYLLLTVRT